MSLRRVYEVCGAKLRGDGRSRRISTALTATALLIVCGTVLMGSVSAEAQTVPGITAVTIQSPNPADPGQQLKVGQRFRLDATWSVPNSAAPGDTFDLSFPSPVTGFATTFTLLTPNGNESVGTCAVTTGNITCTLGQYVANHNDVHGSLFFEASATEAISSSPITFTTSDGVTIPVTLPGGGVVGQGPSQAPKTLKKHGVLAADGKTVAWQLLLPANIIEQTHPAGESFSFDDNYTPGLVVSDVVVGYLTDWTATSNVHKRFAKGPATEPNTYELTPATNGHGFTITIHRPRLTGKDPVYFVRYRTAVPAGAQPGTSFNNQLIYAGSVAASVDVVLADAGGTGTGVQPAPVSTSPATPTSSTSTASSASASSSSGSAGVAGVATTAQGGAGIDAEQTSAGLASTGTPAGQETLWGLGLLAMGSLLVLVGRTRRRSH